MYTPKYNEENRPELIEKVIHENGFATIIAKTSAGLQISHLPLLLETRGDKKILLGHCAKANPQWKHLESAESLTVIFQGPHSYISPAWYQPKDDNVPTWSYIAIHIEGKAQIIPAPMAAYDTLQKTVQHFESLYETGWEMTNTPGPGLMKLVEHIVAFEIEIVSLQAKFKLNQKQGQIDRDNVIHELSKINPELSEYIKKTNS